MRQAVGSELPNSSQYSVRELWHTARIVPRSTAIFDIHNLGAPCVTKLKSDYVCRRHQHFVLINSIAEINEAVNSDLKML